MLSVLRLRNFALVDELTLSFSPGLTCLTGETGAGKSLLADAILLLLGGRARGEFVRAGADEAQVEAILDLSMHPEVRDRLDELGLSCDDDEISIRRLIPREGRSRIYINGSPVTAAMLQKVSEGLIELVGQGEHQSLLRPDGQLELLDAFGGHAELRQKMTEAYQRWRDLADQKKRLEEGERERQNRLEYLNFQIKEIEEAKLSPGEDIALSQEREKLRHVSRILSSVRAAESALYSGESCAVDTVGAAVARLREVASLDWSTLGEAQRRLETALLEIEDVARDLERYGSSLEGDDGRLAEIEDRLALISRLSRKHGQGVDAILTRLEELQNEAELLLNHQERSQKIDEELLRAKGEAEKVALRLSSARREAARRFSVAIEEILQKMGMPKAKMEISLGRHTPSEQDLIVDGGRLGPSGVDRIEMLFAPNLGEGFKPLHRIASGGELSRVTLAAKVVLAQADPTMTSVYDEVDAGIGGRTARVLGDLLRKGAKGRQVLCITHLPQVAAFADAHLYVEKHEVNGRVVSRVRTLSGAERVAELARMMGGGSATARSLAHAEELLRDAQGLEPAPSRPTLTLVMG